LSAASVDSLLDRVASLETAGQFGPVKDELGSPEDELAADLTAILQDGHIRREHRRRIYEDLLANRERLKSLGDPRLVQLIFWGEHVERLYSGLARGRLQVFHYARAMDATCRRCGLDLIRALSRMEELGKLWAARDYAAVLKLLAPPAPPPPPEQAEASAPQPTS